MRLQIAGDCEDIVDYQRRLANHTNHDLQGAALPGTWLTRQLR
jgi:hypothetical protein